MKNPLVACGTFARWGFGEWGMTCDGKWRVSNSSTSFVWASQGFGCMNSLNSWGRCGTWCLEFHWTANMAQHEAVADAGLDHHPSCARVPHSKRPGTLLRYLKARNWNQEFGFSAAQWSSVNLLSWKSFFLVVFESTFFFWVCLPSDFVICKQHQHVTSLFDFRFDQSLL